MFAALLVCCYRCPLCCETVVSQADDVMLAQHTRDVTAATRASWYEAALQLLLHTHDYNKHKSPPLVTASPAAAETPSTPSAPSDADTERLADLQFVQSADAMAFLLALALDLHRTRAVFFGARIDSVVTFLTVCFVSVDRR